MWSTRKIEQDLTEIFDWFTKLRQTFSRWPKRKEPVYTAANPFRAGLIKNSATIAAETPTTINKTPTATIWSGVPITRWRRTGTYSRRWFQQEKNSRKLPGISLIGQGLALNSSRMCTKTRRGTYIIIVMISVTWSSMVTGFWLSKESNLLGQNARRSAANFRYVKIQDFFEENP